MQLVEAKKPKEKILPIEIKPLAGKDYHSFVSLVDNAWDSKAPVTAPHDFTALVQLGASFGLTQQNELAAATFSFITPETSLSNNNDLLGVWIHMIGVKKEKENQGLAKQLLKKTKLLVESNEQLHFIKLTSDPLIARNCATFFSSGMTVSQFVADAYAAENRQIPSDRFVFKWEPNNSPNQKQSRIIIDTEAQILPFEQNLPPEISSDSILVETIPDLHHADDLSLEEGLRWRFFHQNVFTQLFTNGFIATGVKSHRLQGVEKTFILCQKN